MLHFGERIKFLRKKNGLSQEELASALRDNYHLGTERAMISKWETNFQSPAAETLADIADFFGVTMDSFVSNSAADDTGRLMREYVAGEDLPCGSVPGYYGLRRVCRLIFALPCVTTLWHHRVSCAATRSTAWCRNSSVTATGQS